VDRYKQSFSEPQDEASGGRGWKASASLRVRTASLSTQGIYCSFLGDAKAAQMENRLKNGLRPRPKIGLGGTIPDSAVQKALPHPIGRTSLMQAPVLVLNATFEPINVTAVRRALVLVLKGVAQAEETNHTEVHSTSRAVQVPSVIRLLSYRHIPQQSRALSRKNILLRDRNTCQFCGTALPAAELTLDHVMPRSRGGRSSWENLVACCYSCNNNKGDRTPEEAGLKLRRRPRPFTLHTSRQLMRLIGHRDEKWRKYLFY
jgi:5-methylcytosine-specific restriction endonuclease McrA